LYNLPYLETNDSIEVVLNQWSVEWRSTTNLAIGGRKSAMQRKKEEAKLKMTQLDEKRKKEAIDKAQEERDSS